MKNKIITFVFVVCSSCFFAKGQDGIPYSELALKLSRNYFGGSARVASMGGAFGALGADASTLSVNPAGLGVYRSKEYSISPSLKLINNDANYFSSSLGTKDTYFNINEFGLINVLPSFRKTGLISINLGFGMNRLADLKNKYQMNGLGMSSSKTDHFANNAQGYYYGDFQGTTYDEYAHFKGKVPWQTIEAWETGLIQRRSQSAYADGPFYDDRYESVLKEGDQVDQYIDIYEEGRIDEYAFSIGANINNNLFFGLTMGYQDIKYEYRMIHGENFVGYAQGTGFDEVQSYYLNGSGLNFKLGTIFLPTDKLRLGLAVHTPTWISVEESYFSLMEADLLDVGFVDANNTHLYDEKHDIFNPSEPEYANVYELDMRSPWKLILSGAYVIASKGLISVDYEYADYRQMHYASGQGLGEINKDIDELYQASHTFRVGGEWRFTPSLLLRGGYAYYGNPYDESKSKKWLSSYESDTHFYTAGLGYRIKKCFIDLAYVAGKTNRYQHLYEIATDQADAEYAYESVGANISSLSQRLVLTIGFRL